MPTFRERDFDEVRSEITTRSRAPKGQYDEYVTGLKGNKVGELTLAEDDKAPTEMQRLKSAAKRAGVELNIVKRGDTIFFWKKE